MGEVLAFTEEHAQGAAALYLRAMRGQDRQPPPSLVQYFSKILLHTPWADPEIPSLVYLEQGKVIGTMGIIPRPMEFRGKPVRMAVGTQYTVDPEHRRGPAAIALLRRYLTGAQDLSWTDGAADAIHVLWKPYGGRPAPLYAFQWMRLLRPFAFGQSVLARRGNPAVSWVTKLLAPPADALAGALAGSMLRPPMPAYEAKPVSAGELFSCIQQTGWKESLHPAYDQASFEWMLAEISQPAASQLRCMLVPAKTGWAGWFVYSAKPGASAYLLQIGCRRQDLFSPTLEAFFYDAWQQQCAVVRGYGLPHYQTQLTEHGCLFRHPGSSAVIQSRNPEILNAVLTGDAAFSRLDGESWLRFSGEAWT